VSDTLELQKIVGQVAAAYFNNSHVAPGEIPTVIGQIATSLAAVGGPAVETPAEAPEQAALTPAQVRKSVTRDALISFEDNKPYKTLRRHLAVRGLTPDQYRAKWGLPKDYPMVAPSYSEARSSLAKARGLGSRVTPSAAKPEPEAPAPAEQAPKPEAPALAEQAPKGRRTAAARPRRPRATDSSATRE
jgi:predicted transcriptional regulator